MEQQAVSFIHAGKTPRPVRSSEETRRFAWESLNGRYGRDTAAVRALPMDEVPGFREMSEYDQYDLCIERIAAESRIRICEGERLSGASTLGLAVFHRVPTTLDGVQVFYSTSHLTVDFPAVLRDGVGALEKQVAEKLRLCETDPEYQGITPDRSNYRGADITGAPTAGPITGPADVPERRLRFWQSCDRVLKAFRVWHGRYLEALEAKTAEGGPYAERYAQTLSNLRRVPFETPRSFHEALQSIWFTFAFLRLCGNWPGIGRIDWMLGPYLKKDLAEGKITMDEARELMAHFFIKGCEWVGGGHIDSGDAQHYQNLVLGGVDENGVEVTNEVSYLVLDIIEEFGISDFPTSLRLNENTPEKLLRRAAEVLRFGGGALAFYAEPTVIRSLTDRGYSLSEARQFANDGCWEVQVPGRTFFRYSAFDALQVLQRKTLLEYRLDEEAMSYYARFDTFEKLMQQAEYDLNLRQMEDLFMERAAYCNPEFPRKFNKFTPCTTVSLFEEGCIEKGLNYWEGGPVYNLNALHIGGLIDAVNALYAIKKLVYDEKKLSLGEFVAILAHNWEGNEALMTYVRNRYSYFGNDNDEVDELGARYLGGYAAGCRTLDGRIGYRFPAGVSTFGRQVGYAHCRLASPHGYQIGAVLAPNTSPTPGTDTEGATAIIRSYCKLPMEEMENGAALDLRLLPSAVEGEEGIGAIVGLLKGFVILGGSFVQFDVLDAETLRQAQAHPEDYRTLQVRVSGWNARFVTLDEEWQNGVIIQAENAQSSM